MRTLERLNDIVNSLNPDVLDPLVVGVMQRAILHLNEGDNICPMCAFNLTTIFRLHWSDHVRDLVKDMIDHSNGIVLANAAMAGAQLEAEGEQPTRH